MDDKRADDSPSPRYYHNTHVIDNKLYLWGGDQPGLPKVHQSHRKYELSSTLDILHLLTGQWERRRTSGNPPLGVKGYASTTLSQQIFFFGGSCNHDDCRHNSMFCLNVNDFKWVELSPTSSLHGPLMKAYCGMAAMILNGDDYLLVVGGIGPIANNRPYQSEAEYSEKGLHGFVRTNEHHYFKVSTGEWISPLVIGQGQPRYLFTLSSLNCNTVIMFGGNTPHGISNTIYIGSCTDSLIVWQKVTPQSVEVPLGHYGHASVLISGEELMMLGGVGTSDCWIFNTATRQWRKVFLPEAVTERYDHSLSVWKRGAKNACVITFGGLNKDSIPLSDATIIETNQSSENGKTVIEKVRPLLFQPVEREKLKPLAISSIQPQSHSSSPYSFVHNKDRDIQRLLQQLELERERHKRETSELTEAIKKLREDMNIISQQKKLISTKLEYEMREKRHYEVELADREQKITKYQSEQESLKSVIQKHKERERSLQKQLIEAREALEAENLQSGVRPVRKLSQEVSLMLSWSIDRNEVEMLPEVIGRGGWGEVRVGIFRGLRVAAKCLHDVIISDYNLAVFEREMQLASQIRHPNILQFIGATTEGNPIILTELMPTSLRKELETAGPFPYATVLSISVDVACALNYLHLFKPHPILHRDVSSANVLLQLVGNGWRAKLSDYGSANLQHLIGHTVSPGCPIYSAPEAANPFSHSPAMDVYSFAILFIEMATCQIPQPKERLAQLHIAMKDHGRIREMIVACLNNEYTMRPSMSDIINRLSCFESND